MGFLTGKVKKALGFEDVEFEEENNLGNEYLENYDALCRAISKVKSNKEDRSVSLDKKVDNIINWYKEEYLKSANMNDLNEYYAVDDLKNFIEKVAVWYELRYPDCDLDSIISSKKEKREQTNNNLLNDNEYVESYFGGFDLSEFDWSSFYNTHAFVRSLRDKEKVFFEKAKYPKKVLWNNGVPAGIVVPINAELTLSKTGKVIESRNMSLICHEVSDRKLKGMHIVDVINLLHSKGVKVSPNNSFIKVVQNYEMENELREKVFDAIMYRIMERGGEKVGPKRGFIFAKEFNRNIDVPMTYGVDFSDSYLNDFINAYLKAGGDKDLDCIEYYFTCMGDYSRLRKINISDIISRRTSYTEEEKELAQKLVDILANSIDKDELRKENAKILRREKSLRKSRTNK